MSQIKIGKGKIIRFNAMVAGESGQGKTTFLKCLLQNYTEGVEFQNQFMVEKVKKTVHISQIGSFLLGTDIGKIQVHLYDTPGYGAFLRRFLVFFYSKCLLRRRLYK